MQWLEEKVRSTVWGGRGRDWHQTGESVTFNSTRWEPGDESLVRDGQLSNFFSNNLLLKTFQMAFFIPLSACCCCPQRGKLLFNYLFILFLSFKRKKKKVKHGCHQVISPPFLKEEKKFGLLVDVLRKKERNQFKEKKKTCLKSSLVIYISGL